MTLPRAKVWVGRTLAVLGLVTVALAVAATSAGALIAALGGAVAAIGWAIAPPALGVRTAAPATRPADFHHMLDLLRRAHGARAGWVVGLEESDVEIVGEAPLDGAERERGAALVQLASVDGRAHVAREPAGTLVAVGDFPFGAGALLAQPDAGAELVERVTDDLRRLVAGMRLAQLAAVAAEPAQHVSKQLGAMAGGAQTLEGIAKAGVTLAERITQRGAAIVLQGVGAGAAEGRIVAVSMAGDHRLEWLAVPPDAPAQRAIGSRVPVASRSGEDVFGSALPDRRRQDRAGTAYPLLDGHFAIGALVVMGSPLAPGTSASDQLQRLVAELGSRLAGARALHEAEQRAVRDPLTGLRNRREFDRAMDLHREKAPPNATLIYADLDHFKKLNDSLGHAAGDAALRHVARILESAVRDKDLVARIGGEEFAVWMPHTPVESGLEIAERIRATVESTQWYWSGGTYPLSLSCGVAGYPEPVGDLANLPTTADAALYAAKQRGRNRVERAGSDGSRRSG